MELRNGKIKMDETPTKLINYMLSNCDESGVGGKLTYTVNDTKWTLADLFVRQYLNNMCDGFGLSNVYEVYKYLVEHKQDLIRYNLLSKDGRNNSGYPLWKDYNIEGNEYDDATMEKVRAMAALQQTMFESIRE